MLERVFHLSENMTSARTEILAGLTTFLTMSYIIFVQPAVLSGAMFNMQTGLDFGAVTAATCIASAITTLIMALYARYPIALAPGMGENFFFVFSVIPAAAAAGFANAWQVALGVVFISGVLFFLLSLFRVREMIFNAISPSMKDAVAVGIGFFIAFIGLRNAGLIQTDPGTAVKLNPMFGSPDLLVFFFGLIVTAALLARKVRGSILLGIAASTGLTIALKLALPHLPGLLANSAVIRESQLATRFTLATGIWSAPPSISPTLFKMDLVGAASLVMWPFIVIFLFMDVFDTIGTLIGVSERAGFVKDNKLPRVRQAMIADSAGTMIGACLGTSTVTSFIESVTGVEQGGRTGLTGVVTALCFLLALFFSPIIAMVGSYAPITAPALVIVGSMMIQNIRSVDWTDATESIPAFLTMLGIPLTFSIADGLALGFISYPLIKALGGKRKEVPWLSYAMMAILLAYFVAIRSQL